jgi:hypothetical protein
MKIIRQLDNETTLILQGNGNGYIATITGNNREIGYDDDLDCPTEEEELENIADRLEIRINDLYNFR